MLRLLKLPYGLEERDSRGDRICPHRLRSLEDPPSSKLGRGMAQLDATNWVVEGTQCLTLVLPTDYLSRYLFYKQLPF